jgi:hypothetical protein
MIHPLTTEDQMGRWGFRAERLGDPFKDSLGNEIRDGRLYPSLKRYTKSEPELRAGEPWPSEDPIAPLLQLEERRGDALGYAPCPGHMTIFGYGTPVGGAPRAGVKELFPPGWDKCAGLLPSLFSANITYQGWPIYRLTLVANPVSDAAWNTTRPYYFGWWDAADGKVSMLWRSRMQTEMCFPHGTEAEAARGRGRVIVAVISSVQNVTGLKEEVFL